MNLTLLGSLELQEAKRIQAQLEELGVKLQLTVQPESCGKGCKPIADVFASEADLPIVQKFFREERERAFGGLDVDHNRLGSVFNTEDESATCPACGTSFKTTCKECPDCGLVFVTDGMEQG